MRDQRHQPTKRVHLKQFGPKEHDVNQADEFLPEQVLKPSPKGFLNLRHIGSVFLNGEDLFVGHSQTISGSQDCTSRTFKQYPSLSWQVQTAGSLLSG